MDDLSRFMPIEQYKMMMDIAPIVTVDVIFFNKTRDKTMLFRRLNDPLRGIYFTMGGRLLKQEALLECALRQAKRELSLTLDPSALVFGGVQEEIHPNSIFPRISYHAVDLFYGYILEDGVVPTLDSQHDEYKWFSITDESLHPMVKSKISQTLKNYE